MKTLNAKLNKRERRAAQLLAHYATCERLAAYLGAAKPDGKMISVALWKAEALASDLACAICNKPLSEEFIEGTRETVRGMVSLALSKLPPGLFVNGDPRGYALKIDSEDPQGAALILAVGLHTDMGGYGILSPEIDGN